MSARARGWRRALLRVLCMLLWLLVAQELRAAAPTIVLSDDSQPYREFAAALRSGLGSGAEAAVVIGARELEAERAAADAAEVFYVAVGLRAARAVRASHPRSRMLATLIPRESFEALFGTAADDAARSVSAIYIDQPVGRQLDLIRLALPAARRVGVLFGPSSRGQAAEIERLARERELGLVPETVDATPDLVTALTRLLPRVDVLLALPDETVFNPSSAETILLLSYRRSIPLVAFSRAYVKAGALLGLHTTPEQFGRQAAELVAQVQGGNARGLPPPQYPKYFQVSWNRAVAESLQIPLRDESDLAQRLGGGGRP